MTPQDIDDVRERLKAIDRHTDEDTATLRRIEQVLLDAKEAQAQQAHRTQDLLKSISTMSQWCAFAALLYILRWGWEIYK